MTWYLLKYLSIYLAYSQFEKGWRWSQGSVNISGVQVRVINKKKKKKKKEKKQKKKQKKKTT